MKTKVIYAIHILLVVAVAWGFGYSVARGQAGTPPPPQSPQAPQAVGMAFTYQGSLKQAGNAVNATCDFQFGLWNAQSLGTQLGVTQTLTSTVSGGLFSVKLNSGSEFGTTPFNGNPRWLAAAVRCPAGSGSYTSLTPQEVDAAPYAFFSKNASTAVNFSGALSGDVTGAQSSTTVTKLQGIGVLSSAPSTGQVLSYNGSQWAPGGYQGLVIVAKSGGNFTTVHEAVNSINDASDTNRYLVKVMPGVYTETVTMIPYVDIEGSGELATKITYTGSADETTGTLVGASNAEVRFLTVANTGGDAIAIAILSYGTSLRLTHVTATAIGGDANVGIESVFSSPTLTNVTASASGGTYSYGLVNKSTSSVIRDSVLSASGGTYNYGLHNSSNVGSDYNVTVSNSQVTGSTNTIFNNYHFTTLVGATLLDGGAVANSGTLTCAGVYDENYVFYTNTCP